MRATGRQPFQVEVKTFDIVGGPARNLQIIDDGLEAKAELEEQLRAGKPIAFATGRIAPYLKHGETDTYDLRSLIRVIDTLRDKSIQSFKAGQFDDGPTLALAITDRLLLPHGTFDLAPYHYDGHADGGISSGVLWHMAYGCPGTRYSGCRNLPASPPSKAILTGSASSSTRRIRFRDRACSFFTVNMADMLPSASAMTLGRGDDDW